MPHEIDAHTSAIMAYVQCIACSSMYFVCPGQQPIPGSGSTYFLSGSSSMVIHSILALELLTPPRFTSLSLHFTFTSPHHSRSRSLFSSFPCRLLGCSRVDCPRQSILFTFPLHFASFHFRAPSGQMLLLLPAPQDRVGLSRPVT